MFSPLPKLSLRCLRVKVFSCLIWGCTFSGSHAESQFPVSELVGRVNVAGFRTQSYCTGFLVEGGHVLTARHCLPPRQDDLVHFVRGYHKGNYLDVVRAPVKDFRVSLTRDIAILCGVKPSLKGFKLTNQIPGPQSTAGIFGYGMPNAHKVNPQSCKLLEAREMEKLYLNCKVSRGTSGGPVTIETQQGGLVAMGLISASNRGISHAVRISPQIVYELCKSSVQD